VDSNLVGLHLLPTATGQPSTKHTVLNVMLSLHRRSSIVNISSKYNLHCSVLSVCRVTTSLKNPEQVRD